MIVAGVMSGTSADGINVALVRIDGPAKRRAGTPILQRLKLLGRSEFPYPPAMRDFILSTMNAAQASVADMARLNVLLGELYADAVKKTQRRFRVKAQLVGCHGQTIYHQGEASAFLGRKLTTTWQTGEGAVIAARLGVPVVSDFRPADMAAGGKGAPLVPFLDFLYYRDPRIGRIVQNIGGIANLTAIPAGASQKEVIAFDTGPGNMVMDALTERLFGEPYDRDGQIAASGTVLDAVVAEVLREPFFRSKPPKTAGREEFGREFVELFIQRCGKADRQDVVATATALTARSVADAIRHFVLRPRSGYGDFVVSGGGVHNATLMAMLANQLMPLGLQIRSSDEFGLPADAKEAVAFAVLAYETWHRRPSNMPSATGATRAAILGKISYV
jgi:anhydro-N-acetylmuramic acid kinase